jgi:hypothetical protein
MLAIAISVLAWVALPGLSAAHATRHCGAFRATSFTGEGVHVQVKVHRGPVRCGTARRVLRYSITHAEPEGNNALGSPKGWLCARGGPGIFPAAAGYSCEAVKPRRVVTGRFLSS